VNGTVRDELAALRRRLQGYRAGACQECDGAGSSENPRWAAWWGRNEAEWRRRVDDPILGELNRAALNRWDWPDDPPPVALPMDDVCSGCEGTGSRPEQPVTAIDLLDVLAVVERLAGLAGLDERSAR
jgi:hypothetical protein